MFIRNEYPRPQFQRTQWQNLNGIWEFCFDDEDEGIINKYYEGNKQFDKTINVPFSYQYKASGIDDQSVHNVVWYKRTFNIEKDKNALLCFNGVDYETDVWINGYHVKKHYGGFTPFNIDITKYVNATKENIIVIRCFDPLDMTFPRGKQSWTGERFACFYIPNTGIWQSIWLEYFNKNMIETYSLRPDYENYTLNGEITTLYGMANTLEIRVFYQGIIVKEEKINIENKKGKFTIDLRNTIVLDENKYWSPESPNLYNLSFTLKKDEEIYDFTSARFGFRKIEIKEDGKIYLNGEPLYQRLVLDQGYWVEGGLTPLSAEAIKQDVIMTKNFGFNGARKHQKFDDPYYYYYAEEIGLLTWCEMPSAYEFTNNEMRNVMPEWQNIINIASNFTSVICYVPINESWGVKDILFDSCEQDFVKSLYYITKASVGNALISSNDGWENITETDVTTIHDYTPSGDDLLNKYNNVEKIIDTASPVGVKLMCNNNKYCGQPIILSEFGGIAFINDGKGWGYSVVNNEEEYLERYKKLIQAIKKCNFQGFCFTQLTDVQQEVNGIMKENREKKVDVKKFSKITRL